ncbi:MAG: hypothetical protein HFP81_00270 [Methylococcales symbiont of Hymedesmia sp. n. MRB-2018]|nr:MAG: hypothetical protein HFP81_00270 [Methylococcales symbiont of Hymedesmia sp. n. MRB-2018]
MEIEQNAIEVKKMASREKHNGDDSQWKKEIWHSPQKNKDIKLRFSIEGEKLGYRPRPYKQNNAGEWLYDFVWRKFDESGNLLSVDLTMEIEVSDTDIKKIKYDFNKLLQSDSKYKILIFQLKKESDIINALVEFSDSVKSYNSKVSSEYLLCGWCTSLNRFIFNDTAIVIKI